MGLRLLPDSLAAARSTAAAEGTDVSTVLRRWMSLGRAAELAGWRPPPVAPPDDRQVHTQPKTEAGRKRNR